MMYEAPFSVNFFQRRNLNFDWFSIDLFIRSSDAAQEKGK
jgi:hypothetical protein